MPLLSTAGLSQHAALLAHDSENTYALGHVQILDINADVTMPNSHDNNLAQGEVLSAAPYSEWHSANPDHCKSSPGSFDECSTVDSVFQLC